MTQKTQNNNNLTQNSDNLSQEWHLCGCGGQARPNGCLCEECELLLNELEKALPQREDIFVIGEMQGYE